MQSYSTLSEVMPQSRSRGTKSWQCRVVFSVAMDCRKWQSKTSRVRIESGQDSGCLTCMELLPTLQDMMPCCHNMVASASRALRPFLSCGSAKAPLLSKGASGSQLGTVRGRRRDLSTVPPTTLAGTLALEHHPRAPDRGSPYYLILLSILGSLPHRPTTFTRTAAF